MATNLALLILDVQTSLSDVPSEFISDEQIYDSLKMSQLYINSIKDSAVLEVLEVAAIRALATYFSYVNYTSLVERTRGEVPQMSLTKLTVLQRIAVSFLRRITTLPIKDDTTVDQNKRGRQPAAVGQTWSVTSPDMF
jgi:hypothetical protein